MEALEGSSPNTCTLIFHLIEGSSELSSFSITLFVSCTFEAPLAATAEAYSDSGFCPSCVDGAYARSAIFLLDAHCVVQKGNGVIKAHEHNDFHDLLN